MSSGGRGGCASESASSRIIFAAQLQQRSGVCCLYDCWLMSSASKTIRRLIFGVRLPSQGFTDLQFMPLHSLSGKETVFWNVSVWAGAPQRSQNCLVIPYVRSLRNVSMAVSATTTQASLCFVLEGSARNVFQVGKSSPLNALPPTFAQ